MSRAKIVCTIGPACSDRETLEKMVEAGMNVARLNFSHGSYQEHSRVYQIIREFGDQIGIMQDLQGPKIRVGEIEGGSVVLRNGEEIILDASGRDIKGRISVTYPQLASDLSPGDNVFMADGTIHLEVVSTGDKEVKCRVVDGGVLTSRKGINLPGVSISAPALSDKDRQDLEFGLKLGVDFVALSFVRSPREVAETKRIVSRNNSLASVIAKIEKYEAIEHFDEIMEEADGIMIARGDLGVEIPPEKVPTYQKALIRKCMEKGKPVITATQMLESMTHVERPTRAEASDVANAVLDGTDAVMLSAETATGEYPVRSVSMMKRIIEEAERNRTDRGCTGRKDSGLLQRGEGDITHAVCSGAAEIALKMEATAIAVLSHTGRTGRMISSLRPDIPILVLTDFLPALRRMSLVWGTRPVPVKCIEATEEIFRISREKIEGMGYSGTVVLTAGIPTRERRPTNTVHVLEI
ncbi:MAG: pyruvate kinase [Candidatus Latescibacteria bacterium]|nr:pyruvate kinase [bacterium]MBD3424582.1 pyruvate kinase [Candidatus Latescibacterota bacterium]